MNPFFLINGFTSLYFLLSPFQFHFPAQIIVTGELDKKSHIWLNALSGKLDKRDIQNLLDKINQISEKNDKEMANSVLEVSIRANRSMLEELMGDDRMFETLMEIVEPKIDEIRKNDREERVCKKEEWKEEKKASKEPRCS